MTSNAARLFRDAVADHEGLQGLLAELPELAALIDKTADHLDAAEAKRMQKRWAKIRRVRKPKGTTR